MKKLLPLISLLVLTACSNSVLSSSGNSDQSSSIESTSSMNSTSSGDSTLSKTSSSSSSISSSSSSSSIEVPPTPSELFDEFHELLGLKNSTLIDEECFEQKIIDDKILTNHYFGANAEYYGDDGYCQYLDQGLFHFNIVENGIEIDRCKTPNKDIGICEYFCTTYDLKEIKDSWKKTANDFVYTSTKQEVSVLIGELDNGKGFLAGGSDSFTSTLTLASDGKSAKYETVAVSNDFGTFKMSFTVKDLGTTTHESVTNYLATAPRFVSTNEIACLLWTLMRLQVQVMLTIAM